MDRDGRDDKIAALAVRFQAGDFSETVYRASLFAVGMRGDDIDHIVNLQLEIKRGKESARISNARP